MASPDISIYHLSPWRRWFLWLVIGPILLLLLIVSALVSRQEAIAFLLTAGLVILIILPFDWIIRWTRLELSPTGVRLRQFAYTLETPWSNIRELRLVRGREGFVTNTPMTGKGPERLARFRGIGARSMAMYDDTQRELLGQRRFIPIEPFAWHIRHGRLRGDIVRFAPHLKATPN